MEDKNTFKDAREVITGYTLEVHRKNYLTFVLHFQNYLHFALQDRNRLVERLNNGKIEDVLDSHCCYKGENK